MTTRKDEVVQFVRSGAAGIPAATTPVRVLVDGDRAVVHGEYPEGAAKKAVFCVFSLSEGRVAAAGATSQEQPAQSVSGRTMLDGPTEPADAAKASENKALVRAMLEEVLIGGDFGKVTTYFSTAGLAQHNPMIGDGLAGLQAAMAALARQGITVRYSRVIELVGEGDLVFAHSEGTLAGAPYDFCDLYRVADGKIVEHWDVMAPRG